MLCIGSFLDPPLVCLSHGRENKITTWENHRTTLWHSYAPGATEMTKISQNNSIFFCGYKVDQDNMTIPKLEITVH